MRSPPEYPGKKYNGGRYCQVHQYVYWKHTGRLVSPRECLHHKNGDKLDNRFENLELLTKSEHARLHAELRRPDSNLECVCCGRWFYKRPSKIKYARKRGQTEFACSRECSGKYHGMKSK